MIHVTIVRTSLVIINSFTANKIRKYKYLLYVFMLISTISWGNEKEK